MRSLLSRIGCVPYKIRGIHGVWSFYRASSLPTAILVDFRLLSFATDSDRSRRRQKMRFGACKIAHFELIEADHTKEQTLIDALCCSALKLVRCDFTESTAITCNRRFEMSVECAFCFCCSCQSKSFPLNDAQKRNRVKQKRGDTRPFLRVCRAFWRLTSEFQHSKRIISPSRTMITFMVLNIGFLERD